MKKIFLFILSSILFYSLLHNQGVMKLLLICCGLGWEVLAVSAAIGIALGWICSRLDATRLPSAALGMVAFFGSQYCLHGSAWTVLFATFPLGACCALIGWTREERGML